MAFKRPSVRFCPAPPPKVQGTQHDILGPFFVGFGRGGRSCSPRRGFSETAFHMRLLVYVYLRGEVVKAASAARTVL